MGLARWTLGLDQRSDDTERACCDAQKPPAVAESTGIRNAFRPIPNFAELRRTAVNNHG
jgi:hypothetical protein